MTTERHLNEGFTSLYGVFFYTYIHVIPTKFYNTRDRLLLLYTNLVYYMKIG